jgi:hypothetical protein
MVEFEVTTPDGGPTEDIAKVLPYQWRALERQDLDPLDYLSWMANSLLDILKHSKEARRSILQGQGRARNGNSKKGKDDHSGEAKHVPPCARNSPGGASLLQASEPIPQGSQIFNFERHSSSILNDPAVSFALPTRACDDRPPCLVSPERDRNETRCQDSFRWKPHCYPWLENVPNSRTCENDKFSGPFPRTAFQDSTERVARLSREKIRYRRASIPPASAAFRCSTTGKLGRSRFRFLTCS